MSPKFDLIAAASRRPTLNDVAIKQLHCAVQQQFPNLEIDPEISVITRTGPDGIQRAETLLKNLQQAFLTGKTPRWRAGANTFVIDPAVRDATATPIDFDQLNILVDTVALDLNDQFQRATVEFWGASAADGQTLWSRLADALKKGYLKALDDTPGLPENEGDFLRPLASFSDQTQRNFMVSLDQAHPDDVIRACIPQAVDASSPASVLPVLAATGVWGGTEMFFTWQSPGLLVRHGSLTELLASIDIPQSVDHPQTWALREVEGDLFCALAQSILAQQLQQIARLDAADAEDFADLDRRMAAATDITPFLLPAVPGMQSPETLPDWLRNASVADRMDFSRRMIAVASAPSGAPGTFNQDLPPLLDYASQQLQREMLADHPEAADLLIADLDVVIRKVIAAAIPSGGQVVASGLVEPVRMSLAEFALENLSGEPAGALHVVHRDGTPAPDWFSGDYLRLLVCQVDIGRHYPALLKRVLVTDPVESAQRQGAYIAQLHARLPLQALELKMRGEGHFCDSAYQHVIALVQPPQQRPPALRNTTLRPLAFHATAGSQADEVANMFVIGDRDTTRGPVLLYRPFSRQSLTEFTSWAALRTAIVEPGELQDDVLTWMDDHARQIYANGGFDQPHVVRFGQGSEFAPLETPAPAQLAVDEVVGDPLVALFKANASALIQLADRQSTSNAESRWALLKRGGWLALESLMPFMSGPVGHALWLVQLMSETQGALAEDGNATASERGESMGNVLLTVAMLLLHSSLGEAAIPVRQRAARVVRPTLADLLTAASTPSSASSASSASTPIIPAPAPDPVAMPANLENRLDFTWSRPDQSLTTVQKLALRSFEILPTPELPQPSDAPGTHGLYEQDGAWYAHVDNAVFRVQVDDGDVQIVHPHNLERTGPWLMREGDVWRLDLGLRLRGGGPKRSARQLALENAARLKRVNAEKSELLKRQNDLYIRIVANDNRIDATPLEQHHEVIALIETDVRAVMEIIDRKNELDQSLRPADRTPDKTYATDLQGIARRICLLEGVLLSDMLVVAQEDLARMRAVSRTVSPENVGLYLGLFEKSLVLQESGVHWAMVREGLWQRLREVPKVGEAYWRTEALEFYNNRMFSLIDWRASRMWSSLELCFSAESVLDTQRAVRFKRLLDDDSLHAALTSQAELERPHDYTIAEQISVLESSLREYDRASIVALATFESEPEVVNPTHFHRFFEDLSAISDRAEHRLSALIRESEEPADTPAEYVPRVRQTRKRVIKTRGQRTLIGRLREGEEPSLGEVVEVKAATGDRVVGAYHQHAEGEWVEIEEQPRKPVNRDSIVPLAELMRRSRALLELVEPEIASAVRQSRRANEPEDMEDILVQKADKLGELVEKLQVHLDDPDAGEDGARSLQAVLDDLQAGQSRFREQGRQLRIEMIKRQPPTASRISYLDRQHEVHIARVEGRKNMSGARRNDFVQEYAIRDKDDHLLWWAHFHYATEHAAADAFTAAHLKLPEQRLMGYSAMLKAAKDNKEVVSIYRSAIGKELAQRLFLHLAE
ncbi:dermonecrotic toxin domain-containing protein [Pseudomonas syringae]